MIIVLKVVVFENAICVSYVDKRFQTLDSFQGCYDPAIPMYTSTIKILMTIKTLNLYSFNFF